MTEETVRTGGCLCGAVRYEVDGEPTVRGLCHCATYRKLTGSVVSATANWPRSRFRMSGELRTFERRSFCPTCGSRLFFMGEEEVEIFLGTLDDAPNDVRPDVEVWTIRREPWLPTISGTRRYEKDEPKT